MHDQAAHSDGPTHEFYHHSSGQRIYSDAVMVEAIRREYPKLNLTIVPMAIGMGLCDLLSYATETGKAMFSPIVNAKDSITTPLSWQYYIPPARRSGGGGAFAEKVIFGKFKYSWNSTEFILYVVSVRDGSYPIPQVLQYLIGPPTSDLTNLIKVVSDYSIELHDEMWVYDGYWAKSEELYQSAMKARWDDVILDADMKKALQTDVSRFFDSQEKYTKLRIPYKRGVIYYGPPVNIAFGS